MNSIVYFSNTSEILPEVSPGENVGKLNFAGMSESTSATLGKTITRLRKQKGLTQTEFAAKMEVNQSLVTRWERNIVQPRAKTLEKIAQVLEVSVQELLAGDIGGVTATLSQLDDPELTSLLGRAHKLSPGERGALKIFLEAMLKRIEMEEMITRRTA
jgi:transcriptional regulator with XRE-family HTH domain